MTPQEERDAARALYRAAEAEFEQAQATWDTFLAPDRHDDSDAADAAFDRLAQANRRKQDAIDSLWLAFRNRPDEPRSR